MAGCSQTLKGLELTCDTSKGGITEVYIAKFPGMSTAGTASGLTISADTVTTIDSGVTFYKYEFRRNTGSLTSTLNRDDAAGTCFVSSDLVLQFNRMDTVKRVEMTALSLQECLAVVLDSNGKAWVLGVNEAVTASAGTGQTGQNKTDGNFYQLTLQANDDTYPLEYVGGIDNLNVSAGA